MSAFDFSNVDLGDVGSSPFANLDTSGLFGNTPGGGLDLSALLGSGSDAPILSTPLSLPTTGNTGLTGLFRDITGLVQTAYAGEAMVNNLKLQNKIANARLTNQLETVRTTPNIWLVLGAGAVGLFALELMGNKRR